MSNQIKYAVRDIRLGAIYRLGAEQGFDRGTLIRLMIDRADMSRVGAEQLAGHWLTTRSFRRAA